MNLQHLVVRHVFVACLILVFGLAPTRALAKKETASGPIVRPIAWQGETCWLEAFGTMLFTAVDTEANVIISAETHTTHPDCTNPEILHFVYEFYAVPRALYDAGLVPTETPEDGRDCLYTGSIYNLFDPGTVAPGGFILKEDFATQLNGAWTFNGAGFNPGSGISLSYDPVVGDISTAEVLLAGLTPGMEYAVTFTCRNSMACDGVDYISYMNVLVDTEPGTLRVAADGSGDYLTIGSALAVAQTGEKLLVSPGTYNESGLVLPAGVSIVGDTGVAEDVIILSSSNGNTINCSNPTPGTRLANLTLRGAQSSALYIIGGDFELENCRFLDNNNLGGEGGAIYSDFGNSLTLTSCEFIDNSSVSNGGAIRSIGTNLQADDCTFRNNSAGIVGGAIDIEADEMHFTRCVFESNIAGEWGGGLHSRHAYSFSAVDCVWDGNTAGFWGGGAYITDFSTGLPAFDGCTFSGNQADYYAACWIARENVVVNNTSFVQNVSTTGTVLGSQANTTSFDLCSFVDNTAPVAMVETFGQGELYMDNSLVAFNGSPFLSGQYAYNLACNDIYGNTGGNYVGALAEWEFVNGNISLDPVLCDMAGGNISLSLDSPCLPANNAAGCTIGSATAGCAGEAPLLTALSDVPNDQGRQVRLSWLGSVHDVGAGPTVTDYAVYRRADLKQSGEAKEDGEVPSRLKLAGWDYLATVPARGDTAYQTVVSTLCDSTAASGICWSTFMVSAITSDPQTYFDSPPDSGYSVDNLSPVAPSGLQAVFASTGVTLTWDGNIDPDIHHYNVYRQPAGECDQISGPPVAQVSSPVWTDTDPGNSYFHRCYSVTAVDFVGNESPATNWFDTSVSPVPSVADVFTLQPGVPNPFNPRTTFFFTLQTSGAVSLDVFDTRGRKVHTIVNGDMAAGSHEVDWFGRDATGRRLASGVYLVRLRQDDHVALQRVTLLK